MLIFVLLFAKDKVKNSLNMPKGLHILATLPTPIKSCKQSFTIGYPKYGSGSIELTPYGAYVLTTKTI